MKVLFLANIPSPYRVNFFNELGKLCDLTVIFERTASSERDDSWKNFHAENFRAVVLKGKKLGVDSAFCPDVIKHLKKNTYDHVIVSNFLSPTGMLAITWLRMKKIPYYLESDGGFAKDGIGFKEKVKRHFIKGACGYFSTAEEHDRYYLQYGAEPERIKRYPFTSLCQQDVIEKPPTQKHKHTVREKLGIKENRILLAVGRFIPEKGFDALIDAVAKLPADVGCYIVGGEPTEAYLKQVEQLKLQNVHFAGFKSKNELEEFYIAADVFIHPTWSDVWGLVINEAMAKALPVITTDRCIAGLELVGGDVNGYIVPVNDPNALAISIEKIISSEDVMNDMAQKSLEKIKEYTFEQMAQRHIDILQKGI